MRTVLVILAFVIYLLPVTLILLPIVGILQLISPKLRQRFATAAFRCFGHVAVWLTGINMTVLGRENIPPADEAVLFVSNHRSDYDTPIFLHLTKGRLLGFVAKKELKKVPIFSFWMSLTGCLFLDRSDVRQGLKIMLKAAEQIENGTSMWICPEGTRSRSDEVMAFHEGSFKPAKKTGCRVVPVAIAGSAEMLENHMPWIRSCKVIVEFGKPFRVEELPKESQRAVGAYAREIIVEMAEKNLPLTKTK